MFIIILFGMVCSVFDWVLLSLENCVCKVMICVDVDFILIVVWCMYVIFFWFVLLFEFISECVWDVLVKIEFFIYVVGILFSFVVFSGVKSLFVIFGDIVRIVLLNIFFCVLIVFCYCISILLFECGRIFSIFDCIWIFFMFWDRWDWICFMLLYIV